MHTELIQEEDLYTWANTRRRTSLQKWLNENRIPYMFDSKQRVITTVTAVNQTLMGVEVSVIREV